MSKVSLLYQVSKKSRINNGCRCFSQNKISSTDLWQHLMVIVIIIVWDHLDNQLYNRRKIYSKPWHPSIQLKEIFSSSEKLNSRSVIRSSKNVKNSKIRISSSGRQSKTKLLNKSSNWILKKTIWWPKWQLPMTNIRKSNLLIIKLSQVKGYKNKLLLLVKKI